MAQEHRSSGSGFRCLGVPVPRSCSPHAKISNLNVHLRQAFACIEESTKKKSVWMWLAVLEHVEWSITPEKCHIKHQSICAVSSKVFKESEKY